MDVCIDGIGAVPGGAKTSDAVPGHMKHPNAPGYDKWAGGGSKKNASMLSTGNTSCGFHAEDIVKINFVYGRELDELKPRLRQMWATRNLVVGAGVNPLREQMDFVGALVSLARASPLFVPADCGEHGPHTPHCGTVLSGLRPAAQVDQLQKRLEATFGASFLREHRSQPWLNASEQRRHAQSLLTALKANFSFYRQVCLTHEKDTTSCNAQAQSEILGQMACDPVNDTVSDDCMYAELRRCGDCANNTMHFFEYTRFHGPLALFGTKMSRNAVMGQCEEFSRAGYALLASQGFEARYVLDFTDHVWIEVKLPDKNGKLQWVHADPSEGVLDSPLMYEKGWGKKLTMIFAFTPWSVEHVTGTYTKDYQGTVLRRGVPEYILTKLLEEANDRLKYELPMRQWGYHSGSKDRSFAEVALWTHFERN